MKLSGKLKKRLLKLTGNYDVNSQAMDEMNAILLQLTMALMMIFLIAFALFRLKTTEELEPVAQIKAEQQLNFQRQELILALERAEEYYHIRYGMKSFASVNDDEKVIYDASPLVVDGALTDNSVLRNSFINGAKASYEDYSQPAGLPQAWCIRVMAEAGIDDSTLQGGNSAWLNEQIAAKISSVERTVQDLQYQAAAQIQVFLARNPGKVNDSGVKSLLEQYINSPAETQAVLINELDGALKNYAFNYLKQQVNAPLLKDVENE